MVLLLGAGGIGLTARGPAVRFEVEFGHVGALRSGADVQIAGREVGRVESIRLTDRKAIVSVALRQRYADWAPANAELFIASKGLIGKRYLAIGPPPGGAAPEGQIADGDRLRGVDPVQVEKVILRSIENTRRFRELLIDIRPAATRLGDELTELGRLLDEIEPAPGTYATLGDRTAALVASVGEVRDRLEASGLTPARIGALAARAGALGARLSADLAVLERDLDAVMADVDRLRGAVPASSLVRLRLALSQARGLGDRIDAIAAKVGAIAAAVERGEGTVGALLNNPEFINDAKKLGKILKRQPWRLLGTDRPDKAPRRRR
jgi:phospholipid/cholesterol/gamma-HCH transport system substrate-binding protein